MADKNLKGTRPRKVSAVLTSHEVRKANMKEIARVNKMRGKNMESRIAGYLRGSRVLLSGAHKKYKGDCEVYITPEQKFLVECKCSAVRVEGTIPNFPLHAKWFPKIAQEAEAMNAVFGILIIHYQFIKGDYAFVRHEDLLYILSNVDNNLAANYHTLIEQTLPTKKILSHNKSGKQIKIFNLQLKELQFTKHNGLSLMCFGQHNADYFLLPIVEFRDLIEAMREYLLG